MQINLKGFSILLYHIPLVCMVTFYTKLIIHIKKSSILNLEQRSENNDNENKNLCFNFGTTQVQRYSNQSSILLNKINYNNKNTVLKPNNFHSKHNIDNYKVNNFFNFLITVIKFKKDKII